MDDVLATTISVAGRDRAFGELTRREIQSQARDLTGAAGVGPLARVAPVARAWRELERALSRAGVQTVAELDHAVALDFARRLWVIPPELL